MNRMIIRRVFVAAAIAFPWVFLSFGYLFFKGGSISPIGYILIFPTALSILIQGILVKVTGLSHFVGFNVFVFVLPFIIATSFLYTLLEINSKKQIIPPLAERIIIYVAFVALFLFWFMNRF